MYHHHCVHLTFSYMKETHVILNVHLVFHGIVYRAFVNDYTGECLLHSFPIFAFLTMTLSERILFLNMYFSRFFLTQNVITYIARRMLSNVCFILTQVTRCSHPAHFKLLAIKPSWVSFGGIWGLIMKMWFY